MAIYSFKLSRQHRLNKPNTIKTVTEKFIAILGLDMVIKKACALTERKCCRSISNGFED